MPRISFTTEVGPSKSGSSFPRLKLGKNEMARIVCLEEPVMAYVHTLEKPKMLNGKAQMEEVKRKDGSTYTRNAMKYVSSFLCLGDEGEMQERGVDPDNCPACKASTRSDEVKQPKPRYAMNVLKYSTKPGSAELSPQFSVSVEAWVFSTQQFNQIRKLALEGWKLQEHDLILGPCQDETYQRFEVVLSQSAGWLANEENKKVALATFKANKAPTEELESLCGRRSELKYIEQDLETVHAAWLELNGAPAGPVDKLLQKSETPSIDLDFNSPESVTSNSSSVLNSSSDIALDFDELMKGI